jgi:hypothetical protein
MKLFALGERNGNAMRKQRSPSTFFQDANYHNQIVKDQTEEASTISA